MRLKLQNEYLTKVTPCVMRRRIRSFLDFVSLFETAGAYADADKRPKPNGRTVHREHLLRVAIAGCRQ